MNETPAGSGAGRNPLLVFGGARRTRGSITGARTGTRYNPALDSWATMATVGTPPARYFHSAAWDGNEMLIWGGLTITPASVAAPDVWCLRKCP